MSYAIKVHEVWEECLRRFRELLSPEDYQSWFLPIIPISLEQDILTLQVPTEFFCEKLERSFVRELQDVLLSVIGPNAGLMYHALVDSTNRSNKKNKLTLQGQAVGDKQSSHTVEEEVPAEQPFDSHLIRQFSFQNFLPGECNHVARSVAEAIAAKPGSSPMNPFFLYGCSGVGKTHLCHAIGLRIKEKFPHYRVLYVSSYQFIQQYASAARQVKMRQAKDGKDSISDFINYYQQIDVLIIDDIQSFISKEKTQETFFEIFNHLYMLGKQIILTSDQPPVKLAGLHERLSSRIAGALSIQLERPDFLLRKEILRRASNRSGTPLPPDVIDFIAENVQANVRELQGVYNSIIVHATHMNSEPDLRFVRKIVKQTTLLDSKGEVSINSIEKIICDELRVSSEDLRSKSRKQHTTQARQLVMYFAKKHTNLSLSAIGQMMGGRSHATVLHSCQVVENQISVSSQFSDRVNRLERMIV